MVNWLIIFVHYIGTLFNKKMLAYRILHVFPVHVGLVSLQSMTS